MEKSKKYLNKKETYDFYNDYLKDYSKLVKVEPPSIQLYEKYKEYYDIPILLYRNLKTDFERYISERIHKNWKKNEYFGFFLKTLDSTDINSYYRRFDIEDEYEYDDGFENDGKQDLTQFRTTHYINNNNDYFKEYNIRMKLKKMKDLNKNENQRLVTSSENMCRGSIQKISIDNCILWVFDFEGIVYIRGFRNSIVKNDHILEYYFLNSMLEEDISFKNKIMIKLGKKYFATYKYNSKNYWIWWCKKDFFYKKNEDLFKIINSNFPEFEKNLFPTFFCGLDDIPFDKNKYERGHKKGFIESLPSRGVKPMADWGILKLKDVNTDKIPIGKISMIKKLTRYQDKKNKNKQNNNWSGEKLSKNIKLEKRRYWDHKFIRMLMIENNTYYKWQSHVNLLLEKYQNKKRKVGKIFKVRFVIKYDNSQKLKNDDECTTPCAFNKNKRNEEKEPKETFDSENNSKSNTLLVLNKITFFIPLLSLFIFKRVYYISFIGYGAFFLFLILIIMILTYKYLQFRHK